MKIITFFKTIIFIAIFNYCTSLIGQTLVVSSMPSWTNNQKEGNVAVGEPVIVWGSYFGGSGVYSSVILSVDNGPALPYNDPYPLQNFASGHYWGHNYTFTTCGLHHVSIKVTDSNGNTDSSTSVVYAWTTPSDTIKVDMMIDKGLLFLYKNATINNDSTVYWQDNSGNDANPGYPNDPWSFDATAAAVIAFQEGSHFRINTIPASSGGCSGTTTFIDAYTVVVREGLNYIMSENAGSQTINHTDGSHTNVYDVSGDGEGYYVFPSLNYANSFGLYAVIMSMNDSTQAASTQITYGPFAGMSYYHFMRDCLDLLLWDQGTSGCYLGNWRYDPLTFNVSTDDGSLDGSTEQWPILALWASQSRWGMTSPQWVINNALTAYSNMTVSSGADIGACSGDCDGACVTPYVCDYNLGTTGGMLAAYAWAGKMYNSGDPDAINSVHYIESVYNNDGAGANVLNSGWGGYFYGMYGLKKGLYIQNIDTIIVGGSPVNWYFTEACWLSGNNVYLNTLPAGFAPGTARDSVHCYGQDPDGSWQGNPSYWISDKPIATGWALLLLRPNLTPQPMPVPAQSFNICPGDTAWLFASDSAAGYSWYPTTGLNNPNIRNPIATPTVNTNYYVNYINGLGCPYKFEYSYVCVKDRPTLTVSNNTEVCIGNSTTLNVISNSDPFIWNNGSTNNAITVDTNVTSVVWVTSSNIYGCITTDSIKVTVNPLPIVSVTPANTAICLGTSATLTASGAFTYLWSGGLGAGNPVIANPTTTVSYTVTGTDTNGCVSTAASANVIVHPLPPANAGPDNAICIGNSTNLNASGGIVYAWSPTSGLSASTIQNPVANPTTTTIYTVTVTDVNSCSASDSMTLTVNPLPLANAGTDQIICNGQNVNLTASGGGTYLWSTSASTQSINISPAITTTYTVTVTSVNGCTADADVTVHVNPDPPANAGPDQSICIGLSANLNASGGTSYAWSPATGLNNSTISNPVADPTSTTSYIVTVTDVNGCSAQDTMVLTVNPQPIVSAGANQTICFGQSTSLNATGGINYIWSPPAGLSNTAISNPTANPTDTTTYTVTVTDLHGCTNTSDVIVNVNPVPTSTFTATSPLCAGQTLSNIAYTGSGTVGTTYFWNFPGGTVISGTGQGPYQVGWSSPATYDITLTVIQNGCTSTMTTIPVVVGQVTAPLTITDSISCNGVSDGQVTVNPAGTWPYQCNWSDSQISTIATNLSADIAYTVTVTDANGCSATQSITLTQPAPLTMAFTTQAVSCFNGHNGVGNAVVTGGTQSYTYSWLPAGTGGDANTLITLSAGTYTLDIQDLHGCTLDTTFDITQPPLLTYTFTTDSVVCNGGRNGAICFHPSGGISPYAFTWNPNVSTDSCVTNIAAGNYLITVTDHNGCDTTALATVGQPQEIMLHVSSNVTICIGQSTVISATANGGIGTYTFAWNNALGNGSSFIVSPTTTTTYTVTVTDQNNCSPPPLSVTVTVNPPISVNVTANPPSLCIGGSSIITAAPNGGNGLYTYVWGQGIDTSTASITVTPTSTTWYPVTVTDNCNSPLAIDSVQVIVYPLPVVQFSADTLSGCEPLGVQFTDLSTPTIGKWLWDFNDPMSGTNNTSTIQDPYHLFSLPGIYSISLTVSTTDSCSGSYTHTGMIDVYQTPVVNFSMTPQPGSTALAPDILFKDLSVNAYTWAWNFGDPGSVSDTSDIENPEHLYTNAGTYAVSLFVESVNGCTDSIIKDVLINQDITIYFPNAFTPNGDAYNPGWRPEGTGVDNTDYQCYIYDRWGKMIWKTNDFYAYWYGNAIGSNQVCELGVYSYIAFVKDVNGTSYQFKGSITLVK